ncbi:hypothetical protein U1Q18_018313 [Sarracenia purpurea var. burkii]
MNYCTCEVGDDDFTMFLWCCADLLFVLFFLVLVASIANQCAMAESSMNFGMTGSEIMALKEALLAQQQLLQKLYNELDVERESSATAASEALSMILRLQGEKAAVKLESNQYKRLAEEKMCHAEESLAVFEDLIYHKEMEIASLEYQVQAYRYRLLSLGCNDIGVCETIFPEYLLQRNENLLVDMGAQSNLRRNSMPPIPLKFSYQKKGIVEKERSASPDLISKIEEENVNFELTSRISDMEKSSENSVVGDINSYWEQIKELDERVREIADCKQVKSTNTRNRSRSSSLPSQVTKSFLLDPTKGAMTTITGQVKHPKNSFEIETISTPSSSGVQDVFEVPQIHESDKSRGGQTKSEISLILEGKERAGKADSVLFEAVKSDGKDETNCVNKMWPFTHYKNSLSESSDRVALDCHLSLVQPTISVCESHSKFQQLNRISEIMEIERHATGPETTTREEEETTNREEEELSLLKEIREQLNCIQTEIRSWKTIKSSPSYELPLLYITEVFLFSPANHCPPTAQWT